MVNLSEYVLCKIARCIAQNACVKKPPGLGGGFEVQHCGSLRQQFVRDFDLGAELGGHVATHGSDQEGGAFFIAHSSGNSRYPDWGLYAASRNSQHQFSPNQGSARPAPSRC